MFLGALAFQDVNYNKIDEWMQMVWTCIQTNFNGDKPKLSSGSQAPKNPVLLIPQGSYASRTALCRHVDLDIDLVFYEEYEIEFEDKVQTITKVLSTGMADDFDHTGNLCITKEGLRIALMYVWGKLVQGPDFKLPVVGTILDGYTLDWKDQPEDNYLRMKHFIRKLGKR